MYTQCPACHTVYAVGQAQLETADGWVQCSQCGQRFDARATLSSELPGQPPAEPAATPDETPSPDETAEVPPVLWDEMPEAASPRRRPVLNTALGITTALLAGLLVVQYVYFHPSTLARYPAVRDGLSSLCQTLGCEVPVARSPEDVRVIERSVRSHPYADGALLVTARVVNEAPFPQPYPLFELRLMDLQNRVVAMRRFKPNEYLVGKVNPQGYMAPESTADLRLEVVDPGVNVTSFRFEFL